MPDRAMRLRLKIQRPSTALDEMRQPITTYQTHYNSVPCSVLPRSGGIGGNIGETVTQGKVVEQSRITFKIRHLPDLENTDVVLFEGSQYGIVFIEDFIDRHEGGRKYQLLHCEYAK